MLLHVLLLIGLCGMFPQDFLFYPVAVCVYVLLDMATGCHVQLARMRCLRPLLNGHLLNGERVLHLDLTSIGSMYILKILRLVIRTLNVQPPIVVWHHRNQLISG